MKDFHDLYLLVKSDRLPKLKKLKEVIEKTFANRGTILSKISFSDEGLSLLQRLWSAHLNGLGDIAKEMNLPKNIENIINEINHGIELDLYCR